MDPRNFRTWTSLADHPSVSARQQEIPGWSFDASRYDDPYSYASLYHHVSHPPNEAETTRGDQDIRILAEACELIERDFGDMQHKLVVSHDYSVFVQITSSRFRIQLSTNDRPTGDHLLKLVFKSYEGDDAEYDVRDLSDLVPVLLSASNKTQGRRVSPLGKLLRFASLLVTSGKRRETTDRI